MMKKRLPRKLFKYRAFNVNTLTMLTQLEVFYADPKSFNDPFDCDLKLDRSGNRSIQAIERIWHSLMEGLPAKSRDRRLKENYHSSSRYGGDAHDGGVGSRIFKERLLDDIEERLQEVLGSRGVLSLASKWNCPLMWSHYADEHRGICIEYDTKGHCCDRLGPVDYDSSRTITLSDIAEWKLNVSDVARTKIVEAYFFAKQSQWRYENEWRDIAHSDGRRDQPFKKISAIHFGYRCTEAVKRAVIGILRHHGDSIEYYSMGTTKNGFGLARKGFTLETLNEGFDAPRTDSQAFIFDRIEPYTDEELFQ